MDTAGQISIAGSSKYSAVLDHGKDALPVLAGIHASLFAAIDKVVDDCIGNRAISDAIESGKHRLRVDFEEIYPPVVIDHEVGRREIKFELVAKRKQLVADRIRDGDRPNFNIARLSVVEFRRLQFKRQKSCPYTIDTDFGTVEARLHKTRAALLPAQSTQKCCVFSTRNRLLDQRFGSAGKFFESVRRDCPGNDELDFCRFDQVMDLVVLPQACAAVAQLGISAALGPSPKRIIPVMSLCMGIGEVRGLVEKDVLANEIGRWAQGFSLKLECIVLDIETNPWWRIRTNQQRAKR